MVTVPSLLSQIDSLLLDYMDRRWQILPEMLPVPIQYVLNEAANLDTMLEETHSSHVLESQGFKGKSLLEFLKASKHYDPAKGLNLEEPIPQLLPEIVEIIIALCPTKQLFCFRTINRRMNDVISNQLQKCSKSINLTPSERAKRFVSNFENRIPSLAHPFGAFFFGWPDQTISQVVNAIGWQTIVKLKLDFSKTLPFELLARLQNLTSLSVEGLQNILVASQIQKMVKLPRLRTLKLKENNPIEKSIGFEYIQSWLRLAPALCKFTCTSGKLLPAQAMQLFRSHKCRLTIKLGELCITWKEEEMKVDLAYLDWGQPPFEIGLYADYVRTLDVPLRFQWPLPYCRRLTSLTLSVSQASPRLPTQLNPTPLLTHVTLSNAVSRYFSSNYSDLVFEGVVSLHLIDSHWTWPHHRPPLFHLIFPGVRTLELTGFVHQDFVNYLAAHFQGVSHLKFTKFEGGAQLALFQVNVDGEKGMQWPFKHFQNLKYVNFNCGNKIGLTVVTLIRLTLHKFMQPLEKLKIGLVPVEKDKMLPVDEERLLFYSMRDLNYHKELEFAGHWP